MKSVKQKNMAAASLKNLKPFRKGESGNPKGGKKKIPELKILLAETLEDKSGDITAAKAIFLNLRNMAITRKDSTAIRAAELILAYAYGRPTLRLDAEIRAIAIDNASDDVRSIAAEFSLLDAPENAEKENKENAD